VGEGKKVGLFTKIETRADALRTIKDACRAFLVVAAIQFVIGVFLAPSMIIDGLVFAALAFILMKWKSKIAAVILLLFSTGVVVVTVLNLLGITSEGGSNVILALIVLIVSIRATEATFKLRRSLRRQGLARPSQVSVVSDPSAPWSTPASGSS
jgi:ABC-type sugar transport system permease subunit